MTELPKGILDGVDAVIDTHLFTDALFKNYRYHHKRSCTALSKSPPDASAGGALVTAIFKRIQSNLAQRPDRRPSSKNWTLRSTGPLASVETALNNESDEVTLERAIVSAWPDQWAYQMPVASGLFGPASDKRRAVDLIGLRGDGRFDFVELKLQSDTPLYAAMEILAYGLVYLASRIDAAKNLAYPDGKTLPVMAATTIDLIVLAPADYYKGYSLGWLQRSLKLGLARLLADEGVTGLDMTFRFDQFPASFAWTHKDKAAGLTGSWGAESVYS